MTGAVPHAFRIDEEPTLRGTPEEIASALIRDMGTFDDEDSAWSRPSDEEAE